MRLLVVTPIFPNRLEPLNGPYNVQQLGALVRRGAVDARVLCAVPHVPGARLLGFPRRAAKLASLGERDVLGGLATTYLRRLYVPGIGLPLAVPLGVASLVPHLGLARWADVVLGTWAYPDACAAVLVAKALGKPCVVKMHGSDVNVIAKRPAARAVLRRVLPHADAVVAVSRPMRDALVSLGVPHARVHVVPNGVDPERFKPGASRADARRALGIPTDGRLIVFVGRIEPQKGIAELLDAFARIVRRRDDVRLALVGDGVWAAKVAGGRVDPRIIAPGARPFEEIPTWMTAADVVTLPSHAEGTPNVLLEALACGRPAVGTAVGGIPDVLADPRSGIVVPPRDAAALADALASALARSWNEDEVRACGPLSWDESAAHLERILRASLGPPRGDDSPR